MELDRNAINKKSLAVARKLLKMGLEPPAANIDDDIIGIGECDEEQDSFYEVQFHLQYVEKEGGEIAVILCEGDNEYFYPTVDRVISVAIFAKDYPKRKIESWVAEVIGAYLVREGYEQ